MSFIGKNNKYRICDQCGKRVRGSYEAGFGWLFGAPSPYLRRHYCLRCQGCPSKCQNDFKVVYRPKIIGQT